MKILYLTRSGRLKLYKKYLLGEEPADFLYGFRKVLEVYPEIAKIVEVHSDNRFQNRLINRMTQVWCGQNFHLSAVNKVLEQEGSNFIAYTNIDSIALALCHLKRKGRFTGKIIHISQGLTNAYESKQIRRFYAWLSRKWLKRLLLQVDSLVVLGKGAREALKSYLGVDSKYVPFGVDLSFWSAQKVVHKSSIAESYLLSVGSDMNRDYGTLLSASFDSPLKIVTQLPLPDRGNNYEQIKVKISGELRSIYHHAEVVLITLKDVSQPSGQSTAMQALAMGKSVIMTRTKGLWDPDFLAEIDQCILVEKNDIHALENAVRKWENQSENAVSKEENMNEILKNVGIEKFEDSMLSYVKALL